MATQVHQQQQQQSGAYSSQAAAMIECKFDELAKKILDELKQVHYSRDFFQAIDVILKEPPKPIQFQKSLVSISRSSSRSKVLQAARDPKLEEKRDEELKLLKNLLDKQKEQQEQLDSHQQILIDTQFKALPEMDKQQTDIRLAQSKTTTALDRHHKQQQQQSAPNKKSAIPQSTALSGTVTSTTATTTTTTTMTTVPSDKKQNFPLNRSATVSGSSIVGTQKKMDTSESVRNNPGKAPQRQLQANAPLALNKLVTASEKLKQRRPTRAVLGDTFDDDSEESTDEEDYDDVSYQFENLAARRACLNERFLTVNSSQASKDRLKVEARQKTKPTQIRGEQQQQQRKLSSIQRSSTICGSSAISQQRAKLGATANNKLKQVNSNNNSSSSGQYDDKDDGREPRSIGTVQLVNQKQGNRMTMSHLYKPHMNYSTSALGNHHRLSDDDEIIIIPTTRSPTVSPALLSSRNCSPLNGDDRNAQDNNINDEDDLSNMDELSERFSISRTKSFWEKLTNSKISAAGDQQQPLAKSPVDSSGVIGVQPAVIGVHSSDNSLVNQRAAFSHSGSMSSGNAATGATTHGNKLVGVHDTVNAKQQPHNGRSLDSSGGSGNSNYSCSSGSGDENNASHLQLKRQNRLNDRPPQSLQPLASNPRQQQHQQQEKRANCPKTVAAISQQLQEMSRANRFRQTR